MKLQKLLSAAAVACLPCISPAGEIRLNSVDMPNEVVAYYIDALENSGVVTGPREGKVALNDGAIEFGDVGNPDVSDRERKTFLLFHLPPLGGKKITRATLRIFLGQIKHEAPKPMPLACLFHAEGWSDESWEGDPKWRGLQTWHFADNEVFSKKIALCGPEDKPGFIELDVTGMIQSDYQRTASPVAAFRLEISDREALDFDDNLMNAYVFYGPGMLDVPNRIPEMVLSFDPPIQAASTPPVTPAKTSPAIGSAKVPVATANGEKSARTIKVGEAELIYTLDEIPIRYDGTISTLRRDGKTMCFFHSFGCRIKHDENRRSRHSWFTGPPDDPLKTHLLSKTEEEFWDYNGHYRDTEEAGIWIMAMHQLKNGGLLAITHAEVKYANDKTHRFALGLGYSTDKGEHWTYCGEIVKPADDLANVGGGAYILRDGYIYAYYNDADPASQKRRLCVARAKLDEVVNAAARHQVTTWNRYRDGQWDTPALSATPGSNILPMVYGTEDLHTDAAYCTALGQYLMMVQTHGVGKLLLFSSTDGLDWKQAAIVDETKQNVMQPYGAFVDYNSPTDDGLVVGGQFYVYYPRILMSADSITRSPMYRRKITIE